VKYGSIVRVRLHRRHRSIFGISMIFRAFRDSRVARVVACSIAIVGAVLIGAATLAAPSASGNAANTNPEALTPYQVEWVYRVRWGHDEEFWKIFRETQIPVLDKERELGYVLSYQVYKPGLHTSEELRWNYRIVITYKDILSSTHGAALEKQLFPDRAAYANKEKQRWELVISHYDLPIREIDAHSAD
jgi:hypothetical protein